MIINVSVKVEKGRIVAEPAYIVAPWRRIVEIVWTVRDSPGWQFPDVDKGIVFKNADPANSPFVGRLISLGNDRISLIDMNNHPGSVVNRMRTIPGPRWYEYTIKLVKRGRKAGKKGKPRTKSLVLDPTIENQGC